MRTDIAAIGELATEWTYVVVATHGHFDEEAIAAALKTKCTYIALVASRKRGDSIREILAGEGLGAQLHRLKSPAGLDIGAQRGDEIALSILAEIVQVRRSAAKSAADAPKAVVTPNVDSTVAIDPICGMEVKVRDTTPRVEREGVIYYFCCSGCAKKFAATA